MCYGLTNLEWDPCQLCHCTLEVSQAYVSSDWWSPHRRSCTPAAGGGVGLWCHTRTHPRSESHGCWGCRSSCVPVHENFSNFPEPVHHQHRGDVVDLIGCFSTSALLRSRYTRRLHQRLRVYRINTKTQDGQQKRDHTTLQRQKMEGKMENGSETNLLRE